MEIHQNSNDLPKFFVNSMLGNLARKLRLFGYDTRYSSDIDDIQLIKEARDEQRIVLTKDTELAKRAKKLMVQVILISREDELEQIIQLKKEMNLPKFIIDVKNTRCTDCNGSLNETPKDKVKDLVPKRVFDFNERFWICESCKKIYWQGSHITNMQKFVGKLNEEF